MTQTLAEIRKQHELQDKEKVLQAVKSVIVSKIICGYLPENNKKHQYFIHPNIQP